MVNDPQGVLARGSTNNAKIAIIVFVVAAIAVFVVRWLRRK